MFKRALKVITYVKNIDLTIFYPKESFFSPRKYYKYNKDIFLKGPLQLFNLYR